LWLAPGIEKAFDAMQLSFIPCIISGMKQKYQLKIWDPGCIDNYIFTNDGVPIEMRKTIRELVQENIYLNVTINNGESEHDFFRRCLAFQAICCHQYNEGCLPSSCVDICDLPSLNEEELERFNKSLFSDSNMIIKREIAEEEEEEEEEEEVAVKKKKGKFKKMKNKCYNCHEAGHIRRNCPKKKSSP
jgi:hypothetical protein